eukprot:m.33506 g.33506  ORF g.33506 m.33506 type:complete len:586 (-) comp6452_c0_seq2:52-1809(-)
MDNGYDYLKDFVMREGEDLKGQYKCQFESEPGHLFVTTRRFCWQKLGALTPKVNLNIRDVSKLRHRSMQGTVLLKLYTTASQKQQQGMEYQFRFRQEPGMAHTEVIKLRNDAEVLCTKLFKEAKQRTDEEDMLQAALAEDKKKKSFKKVTLEEQEKKNKQSDALKMKKAAFLEGNPMLKKLFINSVKKKKIIPEKSFWETFAKELGRTAGSTYSEKKQEPGISSGVLGNIGKSQSSDGQNNQIEMSTEVVRGIFKLYPEIEQYYREQVETHKKPESLFWQEVWFSSIFQRGSSKQASQRNEEQFLRNKDPDEDRSKLAKELEGKLMNPLNDFTSTEVFHDAELSTGHKSMLELKSSKQSHIKKRRRHIAMLNDESAKILDTMAPNDSHQSKAERSEQIEKRLKASTVFEDLKLDENNNAVPLHSLEEVYKKALNESASVSTAPTTRSSFSIPQGGFRVGPIFIDPKICHDTLRHISDICRLRGSASDKQLSKEDIKVVLQYEEVLGALLREYWKTCGAASSPLVLLSEKEKKKAEKIVKRIQKYKNSLDELLEGATKEQQQAMYTLKERVDRIIIHFEQIQVDND